MSGVCSPSDPPLRPVLSVLSVGAGSGLLRSTDCTHDDYAGTPLSRVVKLVADLSYVRVTGYKTAPARVTMGCVGGLSAWERGMMCEPCELLSSSDINSSIQKVAVLFPRCFLRLIGVLQHVTVEVSYKSLEVPHSGHVSYTMHHINADLVCKPSPFRRIGIRTNKAIRLLPLRESDAKEARSLQEAYLVHRSPPPYSVISR